MSDFSTALTKVNENYFPMIERQLVNNGIHMDEYSKSCVLNGLSAINNALDAKGIGWNDADLDKSNVTQILLQVAALKLNAAASPREVYFQVRSVKVKVNSKEVWRKQIEMGIEGDGNDAILARFGRDVKKVGQYWLVRENDPFTYPQYTGFDVVAPTWTPTGKGNVIRVVYPILKVDGTIEYHIAERDDVIRNLLAHISNQMMNETFDICEDRYKATTEQRKEIASRKAAILKRASELGLAALDNAELKVYMSPAWTEPQSRESMIIRKMRNNVVKKIPKDFGNFLVERSYQEASDEALREVKKEIEENANKTVIDVEPLHPNPEVTTPENETVDDTDDAHEPDVESSSDQLEPEASEQDGPGF